MDTLSYEYATFLYSQQNPQIDLPSSIIDYVPSFLRFMFTRVEEFPEVPEDLKP